MVKRYLIGDRKGHPTGPEIMPTPNQDWKDGYEVGYRDGESSGHADWLMALYEYFDCPADGFKGPNDFIEWAKANLANKTGLKR